MKKQIPSVILLSLAVDVILPTSIEIEIRLRTCLPSMTPGIPGTVIEYAESSPAITATKTFRGWSGGTTFRRGSGI